MGKKFAIKAEKIKPLAVNRGACIATDMILVNGSRVGYMYRDEPQDDDDSGWVFTAGTESQSYMDNPDHLGVYDVNTLANYDPEIIPFLDAPVGSSFEREDGTDGFVQVDGEAFEPGSDSGDSVAVWPPPGFPIVEGDIQVDSEWSLHLPEKFSKRIEDGELVLWNSDTTIWISIWGNEQGLSQSERLEDLKQSFSADRFAVTESSAGGLTRYGYRLQDESDDEVVEAYYGFVFTDTGHLYMAFLFEDATKEDIARAIFDSVRYEPEE